MTNGLDVDAANPIRLPAPKIAGGAATGTGDTMDAASPRTRMFFYRGGAGFGVVELGPDDDARTVFSQMRAELGLIFLCFSQAPAGLHPATARYTAELLAGGPGQIGQWVQA